MEDFNIDELPMEASLALEAGYGALEDAQRYHESFERLADQYEALDEWLQKNDSESFENSIGPMYRSMLAGTGAEYGTLSLESAEGMVKTIAKAVLTALQRTLEAVLNAIANFDIASTWLLRNVKLLERKRATSRGKNPKEPTVTLKASHRYLRVGRVFADEPSKLLAELRRLREFVGFCSNTYAPALQKGVTAVKSRSKGKTGSEFELALINAVEDIGFNRLANTLKMSNAPTDRFGRSGVKSTMPYIGGRSMFLLDGNLSQKRTRGLRFHGFQFANSYRNPPPLDASREFSTLSVGDLHGIPELLRDLLMSISKSSSGRVNASLRSVKNTLEGYVQELSNNPNTSEPDIRALRATAGAFGNWSQSVVGPSYGNALSVVRAVLAYAQASTKTYH